MACSCNPTQGDLWEPVYADMTVGRAMTKSEAQAALTAKGGGGYIRQASKPVAAGAR